MRIVCVNNRFFSEPLYLASSLYLNGIRAGMNISAGLKRVRNLYFLQYL